MSKQIMGPETEDRIDDLVNQAHQIINETSLYEFIDNDRATAKAKVASLYRDLDEEEIERYLDILDQIKLLSE